MKLIFLSIAWGLSITIPIFLARLCYRGWQQVRRLHQIPCSRCSYFSHNPYLKCPVHPDSACSLGALDCADFQLTTK
jgi:hypothetical protein